MHEYTDKFIKGHGHSWTDPDSLSISFATHTVGAFLQCGLAHAFELCLCIEANLLRFASVLSRSETHEVSLQLL